MGETCQTVEPTMISVVWSSKPEEYFGTFLLSCAVEKFVLYLFFPKLWNFDWNMGETRQTAEQMMIVWSSKSAGW
jgi:hypothetical protein